MQKESNRAQHAKKREGVDIGQLFATDLCQRHSSLEACLDEGCSVEALMELDQKLAKDEAEIASGSWRISGLW